MECQLQNFRDLLVWRKAHALTLAVHKATKRFPDDERFSLTSQIRRCAGSISANIAEGCGRGDPGDFSRFLRIAAGSSSELENHFELARDLEYLSPDEYKLLNQPVVEIKKMLWALITKIDGERGKARGAGQ